MAKKRVRLAWIENKEARKASLEMRRQILVKKVKELSILCDVKACLIMFSPGEAKPMVWPSPEAARGLTDMYFASPENERNKKSLDLETYLRQKIQRLQDKLQEKKAATDRLLSFYEKISNYAQTWDLPTSHQYGSLLEGQDSTSGLSAKMEKQLQLQYHAGETSIDGGSHGQGGRVVADQPGQPFGGASTGGGGGDGIDEQFDVSKTYCPDNTENKGSADN